ncbi:MAG: NAD-dependent epimerase/dehydratase family protein [Saprospiraceae bacterium]
MKILVTGASGFIGQYVVKELIERNINCLAVSRKSLAFNSEHVVPVIQDIDKPITLENQILFKQCDRIIHLAWSDLPRYKELHHIEHNLIVQYNFLNNIIELGIKNVSVTGTCLEYGLKEGCITDVDFPDPQISYAIAKDSLRRLLNQKANEIPFDLKWIRVFYVYGEGQASNTLYGQLCAAIERGDHSFNMSPGDQTRDYMHVMDVAKYIVDVSLSENNIGVFNCCSSNPTSVKDFVVNLMKEKNIKMNLNLGYYPYSEYEPKSFWGKRTSVK